MLQDKSFDLIISDIALPGMDGNTLIKKLREDPKFKNMFAIAISAYASVEDKSKALLSGFNDFIEKPIKADEFGKQIQTLYNRHCVKKS